MEYTNIGAINVNGVKTEIVWKIDNFALTDGNEGEDITYQSPDFVFNNTSWFLRLFTECDADQEVTMFIVNAIPRHYSVEYELGIKKWNGRVEYSITGIMDGNKTGSGPCILITVPELLRRKSELAPDNTLTIICTMKRVQANASQVSELSVRSQYKLIRLDKLSENFKDLYADEDSCDVILRVENKDYKAHRSVLIARSKVFATIFKYDSLERQTGIITIPDCDPNSFQEFLEYLYSGKLGKLSISSAMSLYYTSNKYDVQELKAYCIECIIQCLTVESACEVAVFADKWDEKELLGAVHSFFNVRYADILLTSEWESFLKNETQLANELLKEMAKRKRRS